MQHAVTSHPELRILGEPTFLFSFTADEFDIYHVNDFMRTRGWRFNGQQYPNAIHMAVTRPQTQPPADTGDWIKAHVPSDLVDRVRARVASVGLSIDTGEFAKLLAYVWPAMKKMKLAHWYSKRPLMMIR